jgi:hypothetical protein
LVQNRCDRPLQELPAVASRKINAYEPVHLGFA